VNNDISKWHFNFLNENNCQNDQAHFLIHSGIDRNVLSSRKILKTLDFTRSYSQMAGGVNLTSWWKWKDCSCTSSLKEGNRESNPARKCCTPNKLLAPLWSKAYALAHGKRSRCGSPGAMPIDRRPFTTPHGPMAEITSRIFRKWCEYKSR